MPRSKISITLSEDLLARIDREAKRRPGGSRSAVIEEWLRLAVRSRAADRLRQETIEYYESLSAEEQEESASIRDATGRAAASLRHDD